MGCISSTPKPVTPFSEVHNVPEFKMKILLLGDSGVGKTAMISRQIDSTFPEEHIPGTSSSSIIPKIKEIEVKGVSIELMVSELTPTAVKDVSNRIKYYRGMHGIFLVFDISNLSSFQNIPNMVEEAKRFTCEGVYLSLVGNKCDLERKVTVEEMEKMAKESGFKNYFEISCKNNTGLPQPWTSMYDSLLEYMNETGQ